MADFESSPVGNDVVAIPIHFLSAVAGSWQSHWTPQSTTSWHSIFHRAIWTFATAWCAPVDRQPKASDASSRIDQFFGPSVLRSRRATHHLASKEKGSRSAWVPRSPATWHATRLPARPEHNIATVLYPRARTFHCLRETVQPLTSGEHRRGAWAKRGTRMEQTRRPV